ncbi:MAG TPA: NAD(P)-dependent oxidoreductase [Beutenbergiaceae bacterium]|nr:NAD(P)-dependent oxidoreductase [Beutenbergiaceae bacterium]
MSNDAHPAPARPLVAGLGAVDPAVVDPILDDVAHLVTSPTDAELQQAAGVIVRASFTVDQQLLDRMPNLRVIARTGVGTERVDLKAAVARNIPVVITPGSNTRAVAEGTFAHLMHFVKSLPELHEIVQGGRWGDRPSIPIGDLYGATIGIVGFGRIGRRVGELATAFGMRVLAYDPFTPPPAEFQVENLSELLSASDVVTLHAPLTPDTHHLLNAAALSRMRPGAIVVNAGRGDLIDLDAAVAALDSGQLRGLGIDVFGVEPPDHHPIFDHLHVLLSPHAFGLTKAALHDTLVDAAQGVKDVLLGREPRAVAT